MLTGQRDRLDAQTRLELDAELRLHQDNLSVIANDRDAAVAEFNRHIDRVHEIMRGLKSRVAVR